MILSKKELGTLMEMQKLCTQVEDDIEKVIAFQHFLAEAEKRRQQLIQFYEKEWSRLADSDNLDDEQYKAVEALVPEGRYSIFGQDTIWDAIADMHTEYTQLLKNLAKLI